MNEEDVHVPLYFHYFLIFDEDVDDRCLFFMSEGDERDEREKREKKKSLSVLTTHNI